MLKMTFVEIKALLFPVPHLPKFVLFVPKSNKKHRKVLITRKKVIGRHEPALL